ncbi:MAG: hypothetical protein VCF24_30185, partial [Candidatus Latescibacterota bacterium]
EIRSHILTLDVDTYVGAGHCPSTITALEAYAEKMVDPFMQAGFRLAVDGTEPDLIMDILETWLQSLEHEYERKHQKIIEGIMSIQSGDNPRIVEHKLSVIY